MAEGINKINLRFLICSPSADIIPVTSEKVELPDLELSTGSDKLEGHLMQKGKNYLWKVSLQNVHYIKKVYSPNVVNIDLHIKNADNSETQLSKQQLEDIFLSKQVEVFCNGDQKLSIGNDFYVQTLEPVYTKTDLYVKVSICSPDFQMTIENACRMFTAKKMSTIVDETRTSFWLPYQPKKNPSCNCDKMQHMKKADKEHVFPYLVQYNESFYDFLRRTTNRWGEFLYYEGGQLNIGYDNDAEPTEVTDYNTRTYCAIQAEMLGPGHKLHAQAVADKNLLDNPLEKDGYDVVKNEMTAIADPDGGQDKYIINKLSSLWTKGSKLMDWLIDTGVNDIVSWTKAKKRVSDNNGKYNGKYFSGDNMNKYPEHYSDDKKSFNMYSEINPILNEDRYNEILNMELKAGQNAMKIDFNTKYPDLKLGQIIKVAGEKYLVIELRGYMPDAESVNYEAICLAIATETHKEKGTDDKEIEVSYTGFFPPYLETGHIRPSGVQHATVIDVDDPARGNRVRVKFEWQGKDDGTPWLLFAQNAATKSAGVHGRHYMKEAVLVDFINGNVERPYVVGAVSQKVPTPLKTGSIAMMSPAGQGMRVSDGTGAGMTAFVASLTPGLKTLQGYFPGAAILGKIITADKYKELSPRFEGSTEICDYYGIYSIKGCTDSRSVSIKSPWGDVTVNAFTGITISAPNGDVKIVGKNVTIEAGNNLKLTSGTNIKQKFISSYGKDTSALMISQDIAKRAAKKVMELGLSVVDLKLVRNIVEVGFKPQEGTLELKSNRFLKLSAGGAEAGFPDELYANPKKKAQEALEKSGVLKMAPAMVALIEKIGPCVDALIEKYKEQYKECIAKKYAYSSNWVYLCQLTNIEENGQWPQFCADWRTVIKKKMWTPGTKSITLDDLGFIEDQTSHTDASKINNYCRQRFRNDCFFKSDENVNKYILGQRKKYKDAMLKTANELLESIQKLLKTEFNKGDIHSVLTARFGFLTRYVPDDYIGTFEKAFTKDNTRQMYLHQFMYGDDNNIADGRSRLNDQALRSHAFVAHKIAYKRLIAVNLMDEWGFTMKPINRGIVNGQIGAIEVAAVPAKPQTEAELTGPQWELYLESIGVTDLKLIKKETDFTMAPVEKAWDNFKCLKSGWEYFSYGSASKGKILIGNGQTYTLGSQISPIEARYNKRTLNPADVLDNADQVIDNFFTPIRNALRAIDAPVDLNQLGYVVLDAPADQDDQNPQQGVEPHHVEEVEQ